MDFSKNGFYFSYTLKTAFIFPILYSNVVEIAFLVVHGVRLVHRVYFHHITGPVFPVAEELVPQLGPATSPQLLPGDQTRCRRAHIAEQLACLEDNVQLIVTGRGGLLSDRNTGCPL
jgi:hypothetical protein